MPRRVFLLSPANAGGDRARMLLNPAARFELALQLQRGSAPVAELFAFISGLYFRGKVEYVRRFASAPEGLPEALVIAAGRGLISPDTPFTASDFRELASVPVDLAEERYRAPFERDAQSLAVALPPDACAVLLGSIATEKYVGPLLAALGDRLLFPSDFVGRGDMSCGGLMLRTARSGQELSYVPVGAVPRHGVRPPKLPRLRT